MDQDLSGRPETQKVLGGKAGKVLQNIDMCKVIQKEAAVTKELMLTRDKRDPMKLESVCTVKGIVI